MPTCNSLRWASLFFTTPLLSASTVEGQSDPIVNELSLRLEVLLVEPIEEGGEGF